MKSYSLVPSLPDLFNAREKRGGAWYLKSRDRRMPIYKGRKRGGSWKLRVGEDDFRALWFYASEKEGYTSVSEGRTILISLGELRFIDQRCQLGLKSTLCGERCTTPFYQRLWRDFTCRYQAPPLFSRALKRSGRLGTRLEIIQANKHRYTCTYADYLRKRARNWLGFCDNTEVTARTWYVLDI